jgi:hypothetical protein
VNGLAAQNHVEEEKRYEDVPRNRNNMEETFVKEQKLKSYPVIPIHVQVCENIFIRIRISNINIITIEIMFFVIITRNNCC